MTALYFIHGMWSTPAVWDGLREHFLKSGIASHAPVLPMHDRRYDEPPPPGIEKLGIEDYIDFLVEDYRRHAEPPIIAGHSLGGFLAQAVAERVQPPGLILLSPGPTATTNVPAFAPVRTTWSLIRSRGWWKRPSRISREGARWGIWNEVPDSVFEAEFEALVWDSGRVFFQLGLPKLAGATAATVDHGKLAMPALVVVGSEDRITPPAVARKTARALAGTVDYHELPGIGHWIFHEPVVGRVAALIDAWLPAVAR